MSMEQLESVSLVISLDLQALSSFPAELTDTGFNGIVLLGPTKPNSEALYIK